MIETIGFALTEISSCDLGTCSGLSKFERNFGIHVHHSYAASPDHLGHLSSGLSFVDVEEAPGSVKLVACRRKFSCSTHFAPRAEGFCCQRDTMQLGLLEACVQGRVCSSPNLTSASSLRLRNGARSCSVVRCPVREIDAASARALSSSASLFSRLSVRGGLPVLPKSRNGGFRVEASGAYNREAFVSEGESNKLAQVSKRLERTAGYFRRLGQLGFWGQLVCSVVAAVILAFSVVITGQATAPVSTYLTAGGIAAAFLSVFWSFGYTRLAHRLRDAINDPTKAPPRAEVVKNLKNGIKINLLGLGLSLLGLQATVGVLVAKALTSSTTPYLQGAPQGFSPVLALDVFLVQASGNALVAHFLGAVFALELLRSVTLSQPPPDSVIPKAA